MADLYWLGGNSNDANNFSATPGGAGGAGTPTSADNVYWHTVPASNTYTIAAALSCLSFDFTGANNNPTIDGNQVINCYGSLTLIEDMTLTWTGLLRLYGATTGKTIKTCGKTLASIEHDAIGGGWTLLDDLSISGTFTQYAGSFSTGGKNMTIGNRFNSNGTSVRTLTVDNSTITINGGASGTAWNMTTPTNLTFSSTNSTIILTVAGNTAFAGGGQAFNNVRFSATQVTVTGSSTFNSLVVDSGKTCILTVGTTQTAISITWDGATISSSSAGTAATLSVASGTVTMTGGSLKDNAATGGATFLTVGVLNLGGNSGWLFPGGILTCRSKFW